MSFSDLCASYGISRKSGCKWVGRYGGEKEKGLCDRSRAPLHHPNAVSREVDEAVVALRLQQRAFDRFVREYNNERPHEALGKRPPAQGFCAAHALASIPPLGARAALQ